LAEGFQQGESKRAVFYKPEEVGAAAVFEEREKPGEKVKKRGPSKK